jgi:LAO/AO transport system kinase
MTRRPENDPVRLAEGVAAGERRATARAISLVEDGHPDRAEIVRRLYPRAKASYLVGVTGPPGAGKSTLVDRLAGHDRRAGEKVGVICVDPTSPFTGGALLGDRIRMEDLATDPGVFIRSMATRGSRGGLARAAGEAAVVLGATSPRVYLETVGVGQIELDVAETADTVLVVLVPESGDGIQAMKAGLMEIGDIFVVNKADREGAEGLRVELVSTLRLRPDRSWDPPVLMTVGSRDEGTVELAAALADHRRWLAESGEGERRRRRRARAYVTELVRATLVGHLWEIDGLERMLAESVEGIVEGSIDPVAAAEEIVAASGLLDRTDTREGNTDGAQTAR